MNPKSFSSIKTKTLFKSLMKKNFNFVNQWSQNSLALKMSKYDPTKELTGHNPVVYKGESDNLDVKVRKLNNGITVVTETTSFPSTVNMSILHKVGVRDECPETSGACLALKNTYLKTLKHTNETINYGMVQMSGGETSMDYDEETMLFKTSCLEYDAVDMFRMIADMAFEPRSILAANVARDKNKASHKLHHHLSHYNHFQDVSQKMMTTAYGMSTLGMPLMGLESNIGNIDAKMLSEFQVYNFTPEKTVVSANGLKNHDEFFDLVNETLGALNPVREDNYTRNSSKYYGGDNRTFIDAPETNILLAYESVNWTHDDMPIFALLHTLFGSGSGFSVGGPGKGMHNWANSKILRKHHFVSECEAISSSFTDSGLFGLSFTGHSNSGKEMLQEMIGIFESFRNNIKEEDLSRAKNMLKRQILHNMTNQMDRLEELTRTVRIL